MSIGNGGFQGVIGFTRLTSAVTTASGVWNPNEIVNQTETDNWTTNMSVSVSNTSMGEGSSITATITAPYLRKGELVSYTLETVSGTLTPDDFSTVTANTIVWLYPTNSATSFTITTAADLTTEGTESFRVAARMGSLTGPVVASSQVVTITDNSTGPIITSIDVPARIVEGSGSVITINTTNTPDGTILYVEPIDDFSTSVANDYTTYVNNNADVLAAWNSSVYTKAQWGQIHWWQSGLDAGKTMPKMLDFTGSWFNGTNQYIATNSSVANLNLSSGDWTVECVWYCAKSATAQTLVSITTRAGTDGYAQARIAATTGGKFNILSTATGLSWINTTAYGSYTSGNLYHLAFTKFGTSFTLYINGTIAGSYTASSVWNGSGQSTIGRVNGTSGLQYATGYIKDVRVTTSSLYQGNFVYRPFDRLYPVSGTIFCVQLGTTSVTDISTSNLTLTNINSVIPGYMPRLGSTDFASGSSAYTVTINSNTGSFAVSSYADLFTDGDFGVRFNIRLRSFTGTLLASSAPVIFSDSSYSRQLLTVVGTTSSWNTSVLTLPAGLQQYDIVFVYTTLNTGTAAPNTPTGFTSYDTRTGNTNQCNTNLTYKIMGSTPDTTVSGLSTTANCNIALALRNIDSSILTGLVASNNNATTGNPVTPNYQSRQYRSFGLISLGFKANYVPLTWPIPTFELTNVTVTASGATAALGFIDLSAFTSGVSTGSYTISSPGSGYSRSQFTSLGGSKFNQK